ncbi:MAG: helix-turn-helix transcriptional regulator [Beijerinckiaceae bacterium]
MTDRADELLTEAEAARELKMSRSFLAKARVRGGGPEYVKIGRAVRYSRARLEAFKRSRVRTSTSQSIA